MIQRYQQNSDIEVAPLEAGLMLLEPKNRKFCALNSTSSFVWSCLEVPTSEQQLAEGLSQNFREVTAAAALVDVHSIIQEMTELGVVVPVE